MSLPHFSEFGWEVEVLAVSPQSVEGFLDYDLLATLPPDVPITHVKAVPAAFTRMIGLGNLGWRAFAPLAWAGSCLLRRRKFDLVYISSTIFVAMALGPYWKHRFGVPYVLDMQDPWRSDYYKQAGVSPPGGRLKYAFAQFTARWLEPRTMREAAHIICVSPSYPVALRNAYSEMGPEQFTVLPFGASETDMEIAGRHGARQDYFGPEDGCIHWTYLGRGGPDMAKALRGLFLALRDLRRSNPLIKRLRLRFVGTSYACKERAQKTIEPLAKEMGVGDLVEERTERIPYLQGLSLLQTSDVVMIIGSDDPGYSASKVYPCVLARRPILAVLHENNLAGDVISQCRAGALIRFASADAPGDLAVRIAPVAQEFLRMPLHAPPTDWAAFAPYTARESTRQQCRIFDRVCDADNHSLGSSRCLTLVR
jgi:hypothetical protein